MIPQYFHGAQRTLEAPQGWDHKVQGECGGLPVMRDGSALVSVWKPSAEELEMLNRGGGVVLSLLVSGHPVTAVGVCPPETILVSA
jgi:hypothetical protein